MRGARKLSIFLLLLWLALAGVASAQSLSITAAGVTDFSPVTLDGTVQTTTASMTGFTVNDSRLVPAGWHVTVQGTQFRQWAGGVYVSGGKSLPTGSLSMPAPSATPRDVLGVPPTVTPGPYLIDGFSVKIASAAAVTSGGAYDFAQTGPLTLTVPASAFAATYRSDITVSVASGP
jgi:hypothetical protein